MTTPVHTGGFTPTVKIEPVSPEAEKYLKIWSHAAYRAVSPGEAHVMHFMAQARPPIGSTIIDFGCGTGRAGLILARMGMKVTLVDFCEELPGRERARGRRAGRTEVAEVGSDAAPADLVRVRLLHRRD